MKKNKPIISLLLSTALLLLVPAGCSTRIKPPVMGLESTLSYPPKKADGISVKINFHKKLNKQNEKLYEGVDFTIREKANIYAEVRIDNRQSTIRDDLMFHLDWIGPDGKSIFIKPILLSSNDSISKIISSISISPNKRNPGNHTLQVYYYRELIAEKSFELRPEPHFTPALYNEITADITLFSKMSKITGKHLGETEMFRIKENARIQAFVNIENSSDYSNDDLIFRIDWIGPDGMLLYRKQIDPAPDNTFLALSSSISISPDKREPGIYFFQLYLFNELIAEKSFDLLLEPAVTQQMIDDMKTEILLFRKTSKKTGKRIGEGTVFKIKQKERVRAQIKLNLPTGFSDREPEFHIDWIGKDGKSFYRKNITISPDDPDITIKSSISISPEKRQPGEYSLKIYLYNKLIDEKIFKLISESPTK